MADDIVERHLRIRSRLSIADWEYVCGRLDFAAAAESRLQEVEKERDEARADAKVQFDRMCEWMDASYHFRYPISPETLEAIAAQIDCGGDCETAWREWDTNATGCTRSESEEGCPFEQACELRDFAKAIRTISAENEGIDWKARALKAESNQEEAVKALEIMGTAVVQASDWFFEYEELHRAKGTPDADAKADVNEKRAFWLLDMKERAEALSSIRGDERRVNA